MTQPRGERPGRGDPESGTGQPASGVVRRDEFDAGGAPPWPVVHAYLTRGEHRTWVEAHVARSRAFAEVLAALRNDHEERAAKPRVTPAPRRR